MSDAAKRRFPPDSFDVIISRDTLLHIEDKPAVFARRVPPLYCLCPASVLPLAPPTLPAPECLPLLPRACWQRLLPPMRRVCMRPVRAPRAPSKHR